jgi:sugar lactone lactonase YvrE
MAIDIDIDTRVEAVLGEGALWDDEAGELLTIDMISGAVDRTPFRAGLLESRRRIVGDYVGAVLLADSPGFVAVTRVGLELVGPEESTSLGTHGPHTPPERRGLRFPRPHLGRQHSRRGAPRLGRTACLVG